MKRQRRHRNDKDTDSSSDNDGGASEVSSHRRVGVLNDSSDTDLTDASSASSIVCGKNSTERRRKPGRPREGDLFIYEEVNSEVNEVSGFKDSGGQSIPGKAACLAGGHTESADEVTDDSSDTDPEVESNESSSDSEDDGYAKGTRNMIERMRGRWERYCRKKGKKYRKSSPSIWHSPVIALQAAGMNELTSFLRWRLRLRHGENGRRLKGIKKGSSLKTDWKMFLRYYEEATGRKMKETLARRMRKKIRLLITKHLNTDEREKTPMYIEDLVPLQRTILSSTKKRFWIGLQRIQMCLYILLACFTVNRINAMRNLQYRHLACSLQRDPQGGRPRILVEFTFKFAKKYLGITQGNTFPIPEIIYDPSLMLSPHVFLLAILLDDDAFEAPGLCSMDDIQRLWIDDGRQQMPLPLKPDKADHYVFCKVEAKKGQVKVIRNQPISGSALSALLTLFGLIVGFLWNLFTHRFRYGGGTILNQDGLVSDAQQNLIMKHANIRTFLDHYMPRLIGVDMQAIMRGRTPDLQMMRDVTRMGRFIDPRRPLELTEEQKASVEQDPELQSAIQKRDILASKLESNPNSKRRLARLETQKRKVTNTRNRLRYSLLKQVRSEFDNKQAVIDIERQLAGFPPTKAPPRTEDTFPQLISLREKLEALPVSSSIEEEWRRRNKAVEEARQYCRFLEGGPRRGRRPKQMPSIEKEAEAIDTPSETTLLASVSRSEKALREAAEHVQNAEKPLVCCQCHSNARESLYRRTKWYSHHKHLLRHFRPYHLGDRWCHKCNLSLDDENKFRRHMQDLHKIRT